AQSSLDAERYRKLGARPVVISGNLKVDTKELPYEEAELRRMLSQVAGRPAFVAASTHRGEEEILFAVFRKLMPEFPGLLLILVPRHPERGDEIEELARSLSLEVARRSREEQIGATSDIYLGDTIGEMGLYLRMAPIVYMGRSLAGFGGQNPLEPAAIGAAVLSGKHVANFRDTYRNLLSRKAVRLVEDGDMLAANLEFLLKNPVERERMIQAAGETVNDMRGALDRTIDVLDSYVFPLTVKRKLEDIGNGS
ncbi:MAG: 3-deoxy-D-manno-octulosonic acid transferase, partial [Nitratireductor sp.]|nr:3-deoxy-D-manno-octulosonic acid transferase [Nitratireductor sp.]